MAHELLTERVAVAVGGVEEGDAGVDRRVERGPGLLLIQPASFRTGCSQAGPITDTWMPLCPSGRVLTLVMLPIIANSCRGPLHGFDERAHTVLKSQVVVSLADYLLKLYFFSL